MGWVRENYFKMNLVEADDVLDKCMRMLSDPLDMLQVCASEKKRLALKDEIEAARNAYAAQAREELDAAQGRDRTGSPGETEAVALWYSLQSRL